MSLLTKAGIERLSELIIDADKDWQAMGITNIRQIAQAMAQGDIVVRGPSILQRISPGILGYVLTSAGPGHIPAWMPVPGELEYYIPAWIFITHNEAILVVDKSHSESISVGSEHVQAYLDAPGDNIRRLDRAVTLTDAEAIVAVDQTINRNVVPRSGLSILCDGFVEETAAAVQTNKTAEARSAAANDLNLCPMTDSVGDKIYIGSNYPFWQAQVEVGTNGSGNWTDVAYYWNGAWVACVDEVDGSSSFLHGTGLKTITHTPQGDWALSVIQGMNLYWMMIRTDFFVNRVTKPLGSQVWVAIA